MEGEIRHIFFFFFSSRRRHTRLQGDWSSDVCSSDLGSFDFLGTTRQTLFTQLEPTADSAQRAKDEKERGQSSLFGFSGASAASAAVPDAGGRGGRPSTEWPEEEKLRY